MCSHTLMPTLLLASVNDVGMHDWLEEIGYLAILRPDARKGECQRRMLASCSFGEVTETDDSVISWFESG